MGYLNKLLAVVVIISFTLSSCLKETDHPIIPKSNIVSNKISNWSLGSDKKVYAYTVYTNDTLAESPIGSDGTFTLTLKTPSESALDSLSRFFYRSLAFSDLSTQCADLIDADGKYLGTIRNSTILATDFNKGYCLIHYLYTTKATTIKGTYSDNSFHNQSGIYNVKLTEGWNTWSYQINQYTNLNGIITIEYEVANADPLIVPWIYSNYKNKQGVDPDGSTFPASSRQ